MSLSTRAVMPTLVAVSVAPTKTWKRTSDDQKWIAPRTYETPKPSANEPTMPAPATRVALFLERRVDEDRRARVVLEDVHEVLHRARAPLVDPQRGPVTSIDSVA